MPSIDPSAAILDHKVSVVIPAKNAGEEFALLLARLRAQIGIPEIEIIVVDSGSTDSTCALAERYQCRVIRIDPSEFSHSHARNLGSAAASGDYILYTVQDALPVGNRWVRDFLSELLALAPQGVVAATCREFPRGDSDLFSSFILKSHYTALKWPGLTQMIGAESRGETDPKAVLNNVGALVRRDIWERYKLHGYYGEDLDLSLKLLKDGHKFALVPSIKVVHSHTRPASYFFKRFFVSTLFQSEMFSDVRGVDGRGTAEAAASVRLFFRIADRLAMKASGLKAGIAAAKLRNELGLDLFEVKNRSGYLSDRSLPWSEFADSELRSLLQSLESSRAQPEPGQVDALLGRFTATFVEACKFLESVYSALDRQTLEQAAAMMLKIASIVCGNYLAAYYVSHAARPQERESLAHMRSVLAAGI